MDDFVESMEGRQMCIGPKDGFLVDIEGLISRLRRSHFEHHLQAVLAAMHGPDNECGACKRIVTAPIRKAILRAQSYVDAKYWPSWNDVGELPDVDALYHLLMKHHDSQFPLSDHFFLRSVRAVRILGWLRGGETSDV